MNRKMLKKLAVSGFVLGVATGCSGMGKMADAPSRAAGTPTVAAKSADKARDALEAGKPSKAVGLAERQVRLAQLRAERGLAGRFDIIDAEAALFDAHTPKRRSFPLPSSMAGIQ